jgi:hypothetical protein
MDTFSRPEGHRRYQWSAADFDPVFFTAEGEGFGSTKGVIPE